MVLSLKRIESDDFLTKFDLLDTNLIPTKEMVRNFDSTSDYIELHVYTTNNTLLYSDQNFLGYKLPDVLNVSGENATVNSIIFDPTNDLENLGFNNGKFYISYNIFRKKIYNSQEKPFFIKEISSDRTELRLSSNIMSNIDIEDGVLNFIEEFENTPYYKDFILNFGDNNIVNAINIALDKSTSTYSVLIKLYRPLDAAFDINSTLWIVEELGESITYEVEIIPDVATTPIEYLREANFNIEYGKEDLISSDYFNITDLLSNSSLTAYQQILNAIENKNVKINVDYTDFSNFIHFSSAKERVLNFVYKLSLIETYQSDLNNLNEITNNLTSLTVSSSIVNIQNKIDNIITKFDGYENYLYYQSSSFAWPKSNSFPPYTLYSTTSSQAIQWLGTDDYNDPFYGGMIATASSYDMENVNNLNFSSPEFINIDENNEQYQLFLNMIGQHFDNIWLYIKAISDTYDSRNNLNKGVSRDLVYQVLRGLGVKLYNSSGNDNIFDYLLGISPSGSYTPVSESGQTLITASNQNLSGMDYNTEIYKRLYHNISYLLKSKGTNRGIKALISTYGIPSTILDPVDYGGSDKDNSTIEYSYDRFTYALHNSSSYIELPWSPLTTNYIKYNIFDRVADAVEFRFKPTKNVFSTSSVLINNIWKTSPEELRFAVWYSYTTVNAIPSAEFNFVLSGSDGYMSSSFVAPIYMTGSNGDTYWWNILLKRETSTNRNQIGLNQTYTLYLKNSINDRIGNQYSASIYVEGAVSSSYNFSWSDFGTTGSNTFIQFGGSSVNTPMFSNTSNFEGLLQEIRIWSEPLRENVFDLHVLNPESIEGNTTSSAFDSLSARFPLGNNLLTYNHFLTSSLISYHPNYTIPISSGSLTAGSLYGSGLYGTAIYGDSGSGEFTYNNNISGAVAIGFSDNNNYVYFVEKYYLVSPNAGYYNPVTQKIRISNATITGSVLSPDLSFEDKGYRTKDIHFTDVSFSPTNEINRDFISQFGSSINIDDFIGDPRYQQSGSYEDLENLKINYYDKFIRKYNYNDYIRLINFFDGSLFKMIKDFVPARTNVQTGVTIKSPLIERNKIKRFDPIVTNDYNYFTSSIEIAEIFADTEHNSNIGDNRSFYNGELSGSKLDVLEDFEIRNFNPYINPTASISQVLFEKSEYNSLYYNVSESSKSTISRILDKFNNDVTYPAQIQDYYRKYPRHSNPRYDGSRISSAVINDYTDGDISYDKRSNVDINVYKFAWINSIPERNLNFYDKTTLSLKYLIDSSSTVYELDKTNRNLFEVQNTFKKGTLAAVSLFNPTEPSIQTTLEGNKIVWEGGFSYTPIVYREVNETLRFNFIEPEFTYDSALGVKVVADEEVLWYKIPSENIDTSFITVLPTNPPNTFFFINGVTKTGKYSLSNGSSANWQFNSFVNFSFNGTISRGNGSSLFVNDQNNRGWYTIDYFHPYKSGSAGGYFTSEFNGAVTTVINSSERYAMFTSPKNTTYIVNVNIPFEFNASHPADSYGAFKVVGVLEKNQGSVWQYEASTVFEVVSMPITDRVGVNLNNSYVWFDPDDSQLSSALKINCVINNHQVTLNNGDRLRLKVYFLDKGNSSVFTGAEGLTFTLPQGSSGSGFFEIIDSEDTQLNLITDYTISTNFLWRDTGSIISNPDPRKLIFDYSASVAYNYTIFNSASSSVSDRYSVITDPFTVQPGDIIRFGSFYTRNAKYYNVVNVVEPVVQRGSGAPVVTQRLEVFTYEPIPLSEASSNKFAILRKKPDETSVILDFNKTDGLTSKGILIPDAIRNDIETNVANIVRPVKDSLIAGT